MSELDTPSTSSPPGASDVTLPDIVDRFRAYHKLNPAWGSLHVVLDDNNVKGYDVRFCIANALLAGDLEGAALGEILLGLSKTQRLKLGHIGRWHHDRP